MNKTWTLILAVLVLVVFAAFLYVTYGGSLAPVLANPGAVIDQALRELGGGLAGLGEGIKDAFSGVRIK